jgi:hypothetical protein
MLEKFIKTYSDKSYTHTAMVRHKGVVIAFAMEKEKDKEDKDRKIWYSILNLGGNIPEAGTTEQASSVLDVDAWQDSPTELIFPNEIAEVGFGVAGQTTLPVFKKDSPQSEVAGTTLPPGKPNEFDYFRSTTARFTADAPFQVLSDGRYVYVFRQAIAWDGSSMVYVDEEGNILVNQNGEKGCTRYNKDTKKNEWVKVSAKATPLVDSTLLVDRFLLVGTTLTPKMEVRYQRSRSKTRPASRKDSLGPKDLDGNIFYEPTQELKFVGNLKDGHFSVLLLPTAIAEVERWQIFAENSVTGRMDSYNVERAEDGLFNTRGSQVYTCVDHPQVYAKQAGKCSECGKTLIPRLMNKGYSESALKFDGSDDHICIKNRPELNSSDAITVETWIKASELKESCVIGKDDADKKLGYLLRIDQDGTPAFAVSINGEWIEAVSESVMEGNTWCHLAGSFADNKVRVYINGEETKSTDCTGENKGAISCSEMDLNIGCSSSPQDTNLSFAGSIDEVRLWKRARSSAEMKTDMHNRLTGLESDLVGYWRFDEGSGSNVYDQTIHQINGTIHGAEWIGSNAPVGEHPGIERTSFEIEGRSFKSAPTSLLYYQQSQAASGYSGEAKPLKNTGRVMLAVATNDGSVENAGKNHIAALDFGVSATGRLAQIPDEVKLSLINAEGATDQSLNDQLDRLGSLQAALEKARARLQDATTLKQELDKHLDDQLAKARVRAYSESRYQGTVLELGLGFVDDLASQSFDNIISSIKLEPPLQVVAYEDTNKGGSSITYTESVDWVKDWNDKISSIDVQESPAFKARREEAEKNVNDSQNEFEVAEANLQCQWDKVKNGASATMPRLHTDPLGLTISGGLLGFAWTDEAPLLFDSATGKLALHFRGKADQFFVAYYDTFTERASRQFGSAVTCFARSTDHHTVTINISDGPDEDICTAEIKNAGKDEAGDIVETWRNVPRSAGEFAQVLNGQATGHTYIGSGRKTEDGDLALSDPGARRAINKGATLMVGDERIIVKEQVFPGSLLIPYESKNTLSNETLPVFFVEYDYTEDASCAGLLADLSNGSTLIRALPGENAQALVPNQQDGELTSTLVCKWTAAAPGSTIAFDGQKQYLEISNPDKVHDFDAPGDLTLEAWVKPRRVDGNVRVIQHQSADSSYTLALEELRSPLSFDGKDDYVDLGTGVSVDAAFTQEVWILPIATDDDFHGLLGNQTGGKENTRPPSLWVCQKKKIHAGFGDGTHWNHLTTKDDVLTPGAWNHVAVTFDGKEYQVYVNGEEREYTSQAGNFAGKTPCSTPINCIGNAGNYFFRGAIDEVRIWKRARSQSEIQADMNRRLGGSETDLVGYWHFENGEARDHSPHQNHGTTFGQPAFEGLMSALRFNGAGDHVDLGTGVSVGASFTQEAWILPTTTDEAYHGFLGNHLGESCSTRSPSLWTYQKGRIHAGFGDGVYWNSLCTKDQVLTLNIWNHVAVTFDGNEYQVYVNGEKKEYEVSIYKFNPTELTPEKSFAGRVPYATPIKYIGRVDNYFQGAIDEVRVWKRARTQPEIQADMNRRLSGSETDLVGYWYFQNSEANDHSPHQNHGRILGQPTLYASPIPAYKVVTGVGGKYVQVREITPAGSWTHLAAVYKQAYGLWFDGTDDYLDCGNDTTLDISQDLTIEVFLKIETINRRQLILRRGLFEDGGAGQHVPYSLLLNASNQLEFSFEDVNGGVHPYTSGVLNAGFHTVAVTRARKTQQKTTGTEKDPSVKITAWDEITFYIDGLTSGSYKYESTQPETDTFRQPVDVGNSNKPMIIGENLNGIITEARVWNMARAAGDIGKNLSGNEKGLVSWWRFQEGSGNKAFDSKSQNRATINGAEWVKSPDRQGSSLKLYIDGQPKETDAITVTTAATWQATQNQFVLGARRVDDTHLDQYFQGEMEEIRIWQTTRTEEQIQDNLFRRIPGEKEDLIAYYTFDFDPETDSQTIKDYSLRGNRLTVKGEAAHVLSTAPIGEDTSQVRSALAGIRTPFSGRIGSTPAVQEYGDMQYDNQGNLIGIFKRCYSYTLDGKWHIITGYKVGDMVTEWIGQVQFAPQLMGFIEGAPPVPSENLTQPSVELVGDLDDYNQASFIELAEAQETAYTYSSTKEGGFDMEVEFGFKFGAKSKSEVGFMAITDVEQSKFLVGPKAHFEASWGWSEEASAGVSRGTGKTTSLELRGRYTTPKETTSAQEPFGRRFVPENVGLALVQSETADVFALRLRHNGALIAFQMRPNPDIPKDWNIIHFPINPRYVKQGTLDGKIGPVADVDYPNALTYSSDSSYFKPIEAYALKNRIQREETALQTYYAQYMAQDKGRPFTMPSESAQEIAGFQALAQKLHRNLVNTYVWTTDGGLFAETQQTMDVQTETYGGSYDYKWMAGIDVTVAFAICKVATQFDLNAMFGGHHHLNVNKSKESKTAFQLNVSLDKVERDIYKRAPNDRAIVLLDESGRPMKYPYKVDAYRFMSFYLEPESDHHEQFYNLVVDPIWLEQSDDPNAVALRQARQPGKKPPCWRIMHRVTYVSRVLPPLDLSAPPSLEKTLQTLDIDSNYELIKQLEPYVRDHLTDFSEFSLAVDDALMSYLPELTPHSKEIKEYLSLYYGIDEGYLPEPQVEGLGEGSEFKLAPNKPPVVKAGQYLEPLLLTGASVTWTPDTPSNKTSVSDDRLVKKEDLFLTWEFLPADGQMSDEVAFDDPHTLKTTATFRKKGQYRMRLTASDGILSASDETTIVFNEAPVIESITTGDPERVFENGELRWKVDLCCKIQSGLGKPSEYARLKKEWKIVSGSQDARMEIVDCVSQKDDTGQDTGVIEVKTKATFDQSGHYLLEFTISNGIEATSQINLEIAARVTKGLQVLYTFEDFEGGRVRDVSGSETPLDLVAPSSSSVTRVDGGLWIQTPGILYAGVCHLTEAVKASNAITIEAWIKPPECNVSESNPPLRRILTLSNGPAGRNFILAQRGHAYHAGLRTTDDCVTDVNASLRSLEEDIGDLSLTHVVFRRDADGNATLYRNAISVSSRTISGNFSQWDDSFQLALGNEFSSNGGYDRAWSGEYHLVAIYDRALSLAEVKQNFDFGADRNLPPQVFAGEDHEINWSVQGVTKTDEKGNLILQLHGRVSHDRRPPEGTTEKTEWKQVGGPTGVIFANISNPATDAYFPRSGDYTLRLTATDDIGQVVSKEVKLKITHEGPVVTINIPDEKVVVTTNGLNTVTLAGEEVSLRLSGAIKNSDGDDYPAGKRKIEWACSSANARFDDAGKVDPTVTFKKNGVYELTLTATNTDEPDKWASASVLITVNQAPVVEAGPDQVIILPGKAILDATISDDGLPNPPGVLDLMWTADKKKVKFENQKADYTTASFSDNGTYTLKLSVSDCATVSEDELTVIVNKAPVVDAGEGGTVKCNEPVPLEGSIVDDGFGDESQRVPIAIQWKMESGPDQPTFQNPRTRKTTVTFPKGGEYVLRVTASDAYGKTTDTVTFTVRGKPGK